ncbi:hypoxanthine phosphoribosyltransferase [bacterium]|nr:hypoxanthine phosphoribosyltransferase [bacterium]MBU1025847.1 hypoxanthine phosphoribosyltransferase [bacterium]
MATNKLKLLESLDYEVLYTEKQIQTRVKDIAKEISKVYANKNPYIVGVLRGAFVFLSDLIRHFDFPLTTDFIAISSYGASTKSTGVVRLIKDLDENVEGRHVLIVEDIVDSGRTISYINDIIRTRRVASLKLVSFLDRPDRREVPVEIDYKGFNIPDKFVLGYGMDYAHLFRNVPFIFTCKHLPSEEDIVR